MNEPKGAEERGSASSGSIGARIADALVRGRGATRGLGRSDRLLELITIAALTGAALLILSEFLTLFEIKSRGVVVKDQAGGANHAYALLVIGVASILATLLARSTGEWLPAAGVAALGLFALAFILIVDLPDATRSDLVRGVRLASADPAIGFWTELLGGLVLLASGAALTLVLRRSEDH
jgi:hypothetical protein